MSKLRPTPEETKADHSPTSHWNDLGALKKAYGEALSALRWAAYRIPDKEHPRNCGVLGQPLCPLHQALVNGGRR